VAVAGHEMPSLADAYRDREKGPEGPGGCCSGGNVHGRVRGCVFSLTKPHADYLRLLLSLNLPKPQPMSIAATTARPNFRPSQSTVDAHVLMHTEWGPGVPADGYQAHRTKMGHNEKFQAGWREKKDRALRPSTAGSDQPNCRTSRWLSGVLRRSQTARFHTLTLPETRQPRCPRAKLPLCSLAGRGTSGLVPNRQLALKPEGPFTPMDEPDRPAPALGKSPISPLHPVYRETVPPVLT